MVEPILNVLQSDRANSRRCYCFLYVLDLIDMARSIPSLLYFKRFVHILYSLKLGR